MKMSLVEKPLTMVDIFIRWKALHAYNNLYFFSKEITLKIESSDYRLKRLIAHACVINTPTKFDTVLQLGQKYSLR